MQRDWGQSHSGLEETEAQWPGLLVRALLKCHFTLGLKLQIPGPVVGPALDTQGTGSSPMSATCTGEGEQGPCWARGYVLPRGCGKVRTVLLKPTLSPEQPWLTFGSLPHNMPPGTGYPRGRSGAAIRPAGGRSSPAPPPL